MPITLEHVTHTYQPGSPFQATAIDDVSLTINDGELLAIIGHTGSGKSTLAQHLNGLLQPTQGRVLLDGIDINDSKSDRRSLRFQVGLVFQYPEHQLFEETVYKDVAFGPKNMGLSKDEVDLRVRHSLGLVGLKVDEVAEKSPFELSGGQMRRVALAGVLAMQSRFLVLDEPTAGLDPRARRFLLNDIKRLHQAGTTVVMVSHSMDDVAELATRVAVMKKGRIALTGDPASVFSQVELLSGMGLDVPQAARLAENLRDKGLAIPDVYKIDDLAKALVTLLKGGAARA